MVCGITSTASCSRLAATPAGSNVLQSSAKRKCPGSSRAFSFAALRFLQRRRGKAVHSALSQHSEEGRAHVRRSKHSKALVKASPLRSLAPAHGERDRVRGKGDNHSRL